MAAAGRQVKNSLIVPERWTRAPERQLAPALALVLVLVLVLVLMLASVSLRMPAAPLHLQPLRVAPQAAHAPRLRCASMH
jgi:hypothetical protein